MNAAEALKKSKNSLKLPSLPPVVIELNQMMTDDNVSVMEIGEVLAEDPELSTRVLRIANSAMYGLQVPVLDPRHAASVLGLNRLHSIVIQAAAVGAFGKKTTKDPIFKKHWKHSILVADICRDMGARAKNPDLMSPEELHISGLLHDAGRAVFIERMSKEYGAMLKEAEDTGTPISVIEHREFGMTHAQMGSKLVQAWKMPRSLSQTIAFHHNPWKVAKAIPSAVLISVADRLAHAVQENDLARMPHIAERKDLFFLGIGMNALLATATNAIKSWNKIVF